MAPENRPARRMTLRQLLTHTEKYARDLIEQINSTYLNSTNDFRDLSRPVRRKSHFPTFVALMNSIQKVQQVSDETMRRADYLKECLQEIREHARREMSNRR